MTALVLLTFAAALVLEGLGSWISIIGLSALFGANPIIIALAAALDLAKIVVVSLAYQHWGRLPRLMKTYALVAAAVTMVITSSGAAGYLSGEFQKAMLGAQEGTVQVAALKTQQAKYEERKRQIDDQIAKLPEKTSVGQRVRLINQFKAEQADLTAKIGEIDRRLPDLQVKQLGVEAKAGPILYVAKAFDTTPEQAVRWVILAIIVVFDPLAVFLLIAGNFLLRLRAERARAPATPSSPDVLVPPLRPRERPAAGESFSMPCGATLPARGFVGELFCLTGGSTAGIHFHDGTQWVALDERRPAARLTPPPAGPDVTVPVAERFSEADLARIRAEVAAKEMPAYDPNVISSDVYWSDRGPVAIDRELELVPLEAAPPPEAEEPAPPADPEPEAPEPALLHVARGEPEPELPPEDLFLEERPDAFAGVRAEPAPLVVPHDGPAAPRAVVAPRRRSAFDGVRADADVTMDGPLARSSHAEGYRRSSRS